MKKQIVTWALASFITFGSTSIAEANLIRNSSFEDVPSPTVLGQGYLPNDWVNLLSSIGADTWSDDGSYGLKPSEWGHFPTQNAYDGNRFVAGWSAIPETFGQFLTNSLITGEQYTMEGWLLNGNYHTSQGGYEVFMSSSIGNYNEFLGFLGTTTTYSDGWTHYSFSFTANQAMSSLDFLELRPVANGTGGSSSYIGLDSVSLERVNPVPEPATMLLFGTGTAGLAGARIRRKKK